MSDNPAADGETPMGNPNTVELWRELKEEFEEMFSDDKREDHLSDPRYIEDQLDEDYQ